MRGKPRKFHFCLLAFSLSILLFSGLVGQDEVVERVDVVNREVMVRVFDGGEPVPGLTRKDFTLRENGEPTVITSCRQVRRSLAPSAETEKTEKLSPPKKRGRLFLFLLWWNEESRDWPKAWKYFLENIYRPGDRIILTSDKKAIQIKNPQDEKKKLREFFKQLGNTLKKKKQSKDAVTRELERSAFDFSENLALRAADRLRTPFPVLLNQFKTRYKGLLDEYHIQRLRAYPAFMKRISESLRQVEAEKWALLFLQNERLPLMHKQSHLFTNTPMGAGELEELERFIDDCDQKIRMGASMAVYVRDLRSLFIGAGATFHLFLSDAKGEVLDSDFLRWFPVFSSWESSFRIIAKDTGGNVQNTTKLKLALEKAASRPDIYYVLTYKPKAPGLGKPKIKIRVTRPGVKVVYARRLRPREIRPLKLSEPMWKEGILRFSISDYLRETGEGGTIAGDVYVKVSSEKNSGEPLEFEKTLQPGDESIGVEMKVNFPEPGDYILTVAVTDRLSGNTTRNYTRASIIPPESEVQEPMDPRLRAILGKAAIYCDKLQKAAFRFTCTEVVEEKVLRKNPLSKRVEPTENRWQYDYQVVADQGEVTEQRVLTHREHKKVNIPDAGLETRFKANYSVFLPITLLGEHNRANYVYSLLESVRLKKRNCVIVAVTPRLASEGPLARGRAWLDVDNGSVLKIEMDPRGVAGSAALEAAAKKMSAKLDLKAVHWYLEKRKGLRFPSSAEFSESYEFDKRVTERKGNVLQPYAPHGESHAIRLPYIESRHRRVEFYRMAQTYRKYRYFEVATRVEEALPQ